MQTTSDWKRHFVRRFKSRDGHVILASDVGALPGTIHSLVGFLAEVCPRGSLERIEMSLKGTSMSVMDTRAIPGKSSAGSREIPTDPVAVHATVERANEWLSRVRDGKPAGEGTRIASPQETGSIMRAGNLVAGGLIWMAPAAAIEGLQLALRPVPLQTLFRSERVNGLSFAMQLATNDAKALEPLFRRGDTTPPNRFRP